MAIERRAHARVGLLGNPSDGYGGRVLAFTVEELAATVHLDPARDLTISPDGPAPLHAQSWQALVTEIDARALDGATALIVAGARQLDRHLRAIGRLPEHPVGGFALRWRSNIPLQSGLSGSSAIVIAALRALARHLAVTLSPDEFAALALAAEKEELGIEAGPQDRVIQCHEGLLDMDFSGRDGRTSHSRIDPRLLPPFYLAWSAEPGERSGIALDDVRARWEAGNSDVREAMATFPRLAAEGRECLERGDLAGFRERIDANFDLRAAFWPIRPSDRELVGTGRSVGAAVKFCGSGGSVIGVLGSESDRATAEAAHRDAGHHVLSPRIREAALEAPTR